MLHEDINEDKEILYFSTYSTKSKHKNSSNKLVVDKMEKKKSLPAYWIKQLCDNVNKLKAEMDNCNVSYTENNAVFDVVSKAVLPEDVAEEPVKHDRIGKNLYEEFVTSRIQGEKSIWDKMTKRKLKTFKSQLAVTERKSMVK